MKFLVLGATGRTGVPLVAQALAEGHELVAITRSAGTALDRRVRRVVGDVTDAATLAAASVGADAVISALGVNGRGGKPTLMTDTVRGLVAAAETSGVDRVVIESAFGVGSSEAATSLVFRLVIRTLTRGIYLDKAASEELLRASALHWTLAYPGALKGGPLSRYTARPLSEITRLGGIPATTRANVADFLLRSAVAGTYDHETVVLVDGVARVTA